VLERLGVYYMRTNPFAGHEKGGIEKGFYSIQHFHVFENLPGFIGHNPAQRIDIENQNTKKSQKKSNVQTNIKGKLMWWWEAEEVIDGLINRLFEEQMKFHSKIAQMMQIANLHILLGKQEARKLQREGITYGGRLYINPEIYNHFGAGEVVEVYEEIDDVSVVYAKVGENEFVRMVDEKQANISVEEAKEAKKAYKKEHIEAVKKAIASGWRTFEEMKWVNVDGSKEFSKIEHAPVAKKVVKPESKEVSNVSDLDRLIEMAGGYG